MSIFSKVFLSFSSFFESLHIYLKQNFSYICFLYILFSFFFLSPHAHPLFSQLIPFFILLPFPLENYGRAIEDCVSSLKHDPTFVKSYYRLAKAYLNVDRLKEAHETVSKGLTISPGNKDLESLKGEIEKEKEKQRKIKEEKAQSAVEAHKRDTLIKEIMRAKGMQMGSRFLHPLQQGCVDVCGEGYLFIIYLLFIYYLFII